MAGLARHGPPVLICSLSGGVSQCRIKSPRQPRHSKELLQRLQRSFPPLALVGSMLQTLPHPSQTLDMGEAQPSQAGIVSGHFIGALT